MKKLDIISQGTTTVVEAMRAHKISYTEAVARTTRTFSTERRASKILVTNDVGEIACVVPYGDKEGSAMAELIAKLLTDQQLRGRPCSCGTKGTDDELVSVGKVAL